MPNLITDRTAGVAQGSAALNVRRLMYQSLIWSADLCDHARRLRPALDAKHVKRAADPLVDGVGGDAELDGNLFRGEMLVDQQEGIELALAEARDARGQGRIRVIAGRSVRPAIVMIICELTLHQHGWLFTAKDKIRQKTPAIARLNPV